MPDDRIADRTAGTADHLNPSRFPGAGAAKDRFLEAQAAGWASFNQKLSISPFRSAANVVVTRVPIFSSPSAFLKKVARSIQIQRHSSSPTGLSGGSAKPILDIAHEKSAKRQEERDLMLRPWSSNLPNRFRQEEFRCRQGGRFANLARRVNACDAFWSPWKATSVGARSTVVDIGPPCPGHGPQAGQVAPVGPT